MKKISIILALLVLLTTSSASYAEGLLERAKAANSTASRSAIKTQVSENTMENLKQRATTEITRRVKFLTELSSKIDGLKKLSDAQKTDLKSQIQVQIDGLNALQAKINADTTLETLKTDVKSIVNGYYIFAFFRVKVSLLVATNRMGYTTDLLNTVYAKLQTRINEKQAKGEDVTSLNTLLTDMQAKITSAKTNYEAGQTELTSLTAQGYPENKTILLDARAKIKQGEKDLRAAYQDAVKIRQGLGDISGNLKKGTFEDKQGSQSAGL
jgi:predicted  nucleic acid-binding Zn-ribbon protein